MTQKCYYLAYGSNLHPLRLYERISSSQFIDTVELSGHNVYFHKHCTLDGSGKCNLVYTGNSEHRALAAVYEMDLSQKPLLDEFEGVGYQTVTETIPVAGNNQEVFWYQAIDNFINNSLQPYDWYQQIVVLGSDYHQFPEAYRQHLHSFGSISDPDPERHQDRFGLIERMQEYQHD